MREANFESGYSDVGGLSMYYEIHGEGKPLVLIHGGGSTIQTTYGNLIPLLSKHRRIIAMDLQAHGRTGDRPSPLTFEQDADDVAALLRNLHITKADFLGYSNGGHTLIELALRHPALIDRMIIASSFYKRSAVMPEFWEGLDTATIDVMPQSLKDGFLKVNNDEKALLNMFRKDVQKMKAFKGWTDEQMRSIKALTLIINGNSDVGSVEHAVEMFRIMPNARLAILPGRHGAYIGAIEYLDKARWTQQYVADLFNDFLNGDS